jgi:hypothetical protein
MDDNIETVKIDFEIKPQYVEINLAPDDFIIIIKIIKNDNIIRKFNSYISTPDDLFTTLNEVIKGNNVNINLEGGGNEGPDISIGNIKLKLRFIRISHNKFRYPPFALNKNIEIEIINEIMRRLISEIEDEKYRESMKSHYENWISSKRLDPPIEKASIIIQPEPFIYYFRSEDYKESIIKLFNEYKKLLIERYPDYENDIAYKRNFEAITIAKNK